MNDRQPSDALNTDALAREVEQALKVDPSPEFLARIRTRVAEEPSAAVSTWRLRWGLMTAGLGMAAGIVAMLYVGISSARVVPRNSSSAPQAATGAEDLELSPLTQPPVALQREVPVLEDGPVVGKLGGVVARSVSGTPTVARRDAWSFPDVLVSPAEAEALRALVADAHAGRFVIVPATDGPQVDIPADAEEDVSPEPEELVITPLEIQPLVKVMTREEREGEVE